tara:strand:+ start:18612 stop:20450 length:1839 start_codon:yes stop_codon:yes gene_type:complete
MKLSINASTNALYIYGAISDTEISAKSVVEQLKALNQNDTVKVHINCQGGDVMQGLAVYNAIKALPKSEIYIDGLAASMGSVIAMAGKKVYMASNAFLMIHNPWTLAAGDSEDLRASADVLDKIKPSLLDAYTTKTGKSKEEISNLMTEETWLNADEALEAGFIDEIAQEIRLAASIDLSVFNKVPDSLKNALEIEKQRVSEISFMAKALDLDAKTFIQSETTLEEAREAMLHEAGKNTKPTTGATTMNDDNIKSFFNDAQDAILIRNGIRAKNVSAGAEELSKYSVLGLAEKLLSLHGISASMLDRKGIINKALEIKALHSTGDFSTLLGNTAGKALRMAYMEEIGSHEIWTGETEVQDFKEQSLIQLSEAPNLDLVLEGGEYKYGSFGDGAEKFSIAKYGKMFSITYEALINDDLSAFTRLPMAFGKSAKRKETDLVYSILTGNPNLSDSKALFHTDHGNIITNGTGMDVATISAARTKMRKQRGFNSEVPINVVPRYLIVPASLETAGEQLLSSLVDPSKNNDTINPAYVRNLQLVVDSRLDADSETTWYMAADPAQVDTITRAYLAGSGRPSYETKDGWEVDGMTVKARLEVAAVPADYRGLIRVAQA